MQDIRIQLSQAEIAELTNFLDDKSRPEGTLCFQELQGFLFAVACCPEMIPPPDWLPIIADDQDIGFKDTSEAQQILDLIMTLFNQVNTAVLEPSDKLPPGCEFQEDIEANFDDKMEISQWSRGFMLGHDWLTDLWDEFVPESLDEECGSCAMALSFFASRQLAEVYYLDATTTQRRRKPRVSFNEFAETVRNVFPDAMATYAVLGRAISEVLDGVVETGP